MTMRIHAIVVQIREFEAVPLGPFINNDSKLLNTFCNESPSVN